MKHFLSFHSSSILGLISHSNSIQHQSARLWRQGHPTIPRPRFLFVLVSPVRSGKPWAQASEVSAPCAAAETFCPIPFRRTRKCFCRISHRWRDSQFRQSRSPFGCESLCCKPCPMHIIVRRSSFNAFWVWGKLSKPVWLRTGATDPRCLACMVTSRPGVQTITVSRCR